MQTETVRVTAHIGMDAREGLKRLADENGMKFERYVANLLENASLDAPPPPKRKGKHK